MSMNELSQLKGSWDEVKARLPDIIMYYEADIALAIGRLSIKGKSGAEALKEQTAWPVFYSMKKAELDKLLKYMNAQVEACRGKLYKRYTESYSRDIGDRGKEKYIDNEPEYMGYYQLYLELEELRDKYTAICDAWDKRGFALRDWTALKIAEMQNAEI